MNRHYCQYKTTNCIGDTLDFSGWSSPPTDISQIYVICPPLGLLTAPRLCWIKQA